ncbi:MAG: AsmA-like C-terminal domain-containing protein [Deltaproteobacteria bacterium]|nr:AsmA-like C-terminal domain-containing protein [Deltaproteobacteria bacterium]
MASRIRINLSLRQLLKGHIVPTGLTLVEPQIELDTENGWSFSESGGGAFLGRTPVTGLAGFPSVTLEQAHITLKGTPVKARSLFLRLSRRPKDPTRFDVTLKGKIDYRGEVIPLSAMGHITRDKNVGTAAHVKLSASRIPLSHIRLPDLPVKKGTAAVEVTAVGSPGGAFSAKGEITINDIEFLIIDDGDKKSFSFEKVSLPFDAVYADSILQIPSLQMKAHGFTLNVNSRLDLRDTSNPHLDLSVKSEAMPVETFQRIFPSSLLPQWVDARLFPIFSDGHVRVDLFSLKGKLDRIRDLDLPKNAGALLLRLTCNDLTAFKDAGGVPVDRVSGKLEIKKGGMHVSGVKAHFRNSSMREGSLNVSNLYVDAPSIRVTAAGSFHIQDLLQQKDLALIPDEVRRHLLRFESATGKIDGTIEVGYETAWLYPKLLRGNLTFTDCAMADNALIFPVFLEEGELIVDGEGKRRFSVRGRWGRSAIDASGDIGGSWETGKARIVAQADIGELIGHFHPDLQSSIRFRNRVPCRISLIKGMNDWVFNGELDLKNASLETESMTIDPFGDRGELRFRGGLRPGDTFYITELTCRLDESSFKLGGTYDLKGNELFELRVSSKKILLEDLGVHFKKGNLRGKGALEFDAAIKGSRSQPMMTAVTGEARARDLFFATNDFPHPVENCDFGLKFNGKSLAIQFLDLKLGKSPFRIKGELKGWDGMQGELTITSDFLDLSDLISPEFLARFKEKTSAPPDLIGFDQGPGSAPVPWQEGAHRFMEKSDIHLNIAAPTGQWEGFPYGPLRIDCALRGGDLYISRSSATWEHGKLRLRGYVKRGEWPEMLFSGYLDVTRQPIGELPPSLAFITSRAEGMLTTEALLFAKGTNKEDLIASLTGTVNVRVDQGVLKKSHVFIKVLDFMSLQRMFEERPPGLSKDGLYFERIGANIDLDKGIAKTEDVTMESPVFNAAAMGEANLLRARVNAELGVQPLGLIDSLVSKIPIAGYLLTGDRKALYVDYFKVEGALSDPDVRYIPMKSLGNATVGLLTRLLLSPTRIYRSIADAARNFEGKGYPLPDEHLKPEKDMGG